MTDCINTEITATMIDQLAGVKADLEAIYAHQKFRVAVIEPQDLHRFTVYAVSENGTHTLEVERIGSTRVLGYPERGAA
jgi:hypothetical protein